MTDNEIIKALECCISNTDENCNKCVCSGSNVSCLDVLLQNALDLINRLQAENERLEFEVKLLTEKSITAKYPHSVSVSKGIILTKDWDDYEKLIADIANEARKECIEKLKEKTKGLIGQNFLDDFLKEMVGEQK